MKVCRTCNSDQRANDGAVCTNCYTPLSGSSEPVEIVEELELFEAEDLPLTLDPTKSQYKVISQKDRFFSNKFDPARIERALNEYAQDGWTLVNAVSADFPGLGGSRNELVLFLEKKPNG